MAKNLVNVSATVWRRTANSGEAPAEAGLASMQMQETGVVVVGGGDAEIQNQSDDLRSLL